jgi:hypothetical protein
MTAFRAIHPSFQARINPLKGLGSGAPKEVIRTFGRNR